MGFAILGIVFCHLDVALNYNGYPKTRLAILLQLFTVGVDIFMLLSGMGLYYSFSNKKQSYGCFIRKRVLRLWPTYFVIAGIIGFIHTVIIKELGIVRFFENLFFISWPKYNSTVCWFVLTIFAFYAVFPIIYKVVQGSKDRGLLKYLAFLLAFWLITATIHHFFSNYSTFKIAIERLPIFVAGVCCGKLSYEHKQISAKIVIPLCIVGFISTGFQLLSSTYKHWIKNTHYAYYCTRGLFAIAIILVIIATMEYLEKKSGKLYTLITNVLCFLGGITLEIYLLHTHSLKLFDYPYKLGMHLVCAVIIPIVLASVWEIIRRKRKGTKQ